MMRKHSAVSCQRLASGLCAALVALAFGAAADARAAGLDAVSCRVSCPGPAGPPQGGSGTLVDVSADGELGIVLTNSHVIADSPGPYKVTFADGASHGARLLAHDPDLDLAGLLIAKPNRRPAQWVGKIYGETFYAAGFGNFEERFRVTGGQIVAHLGARGGRQMSYEITASSRQGDSGGGVFNERGELCGIRWGGGEGSTVFVTPEQMAEFIGRLGVASVPPTQYGGMPCVPAAGGVSCGVGINWGGQCGPGRVCPPQQPVGRPVYQLPQQPSAPAIAAPPAALQPAAGAGAAATAPAAACACGPKWTALEARLAAIEAKPGVPGPRGPQGERGPAGPAVDADALAKQVAQLVMAQLPSPTAASPPGVSHYVLVADDGADYWPRLADEFRRAREAYSGLRVSGVPDVPVGPLPQLVAYRDGKPLGAFRGRRDVSDALVRIAGGKAPLP